MRSNKNNGSRALCARGFIVLWTALVIGLGLIARPAEAAPFAYVANGGSNTVSVIDTATKTVVATVGVGSGPDGIAVTPDGTQVYVANSGSNNVSVIHRPGNTVVKAIPVGTTPVGVAVTPDGTHVYVANNNSDTISVIARPGNTVVATIPVGTGPVGVAIGP